MTDAQDPSGIESRTRISDLGLARERLPSWRYTAAVRSVVLWVAVSCVACGGSSPRAESDASVADTEVENDFDAGGWPDTRDAAEVEEAAVQLPVPPEWPDSDVAHAEAIWARQANAARADYDAFALGASTGAIVVGGLYRAKINLGDGERTTGLPSGLSGPDKPFLAKYLPDGSLAWTSFPETPNGRVLRVTLDATESVWVGGFFRDRINLGGVTLEGAPAIGTSAFLARLAADGSHVWSRALINAKATSGYAAVYPVLRAADDVLIAGSFSGSIDLGAGSIDSGPTGAAALLAKLRPDGTQIFARVFRSTLSAGIYRTTLCSSGRVVALGQYYGEATFGSTTLPPLDTAWPAESAEWVGLFESNGTPVWVRAMALRPKTGSTRMRAGQVTAVACAEGDTAVAVGWFEREADFGEGRIVSTALTSNGYVAWVNDKGVMTRLETSPEIVRHGVSDVVADDSGLTLLVAAGSGGTYRSLVRLGATGVEWARTLSPQNGIFRLLRDALGNHVVTGGFREPIEIGGTIKLTPPGDDHDAFVAKLGP